MSCLTETAIPPNVENETIQEEHAQTAFGNEESILSGDSI